MSQSQEKIEVVVLAAGKGVRMGSELPKVLHRVCGTSLVRRIIDSVLELKPRAIHVVVGYKQELVRAELANIQAAGASISAVEQLEQKGTGHAVQLALPSVGADCDSVLILPGDVPLLSGKTLCSFVEASRGAKLAVLSANVADATGFGRIVRDKGGKVERIVEHKDCNEVERKISEINASIYLVERKLLGEALATLVPNNAQGELYLTDIVGHASSRGIPVVAHLAQNSDEVLGANSIAELSALEKKKRQEIVARHMAAGVSFENPECSYIEESVTIGADSFVGAGSRIQGKTVIGKGVVIEGDSLIRDCSIGDKCRIKLGSYLEESIIGPECSIGPFAHLRPQSKLERGVKIGNFVELKKAELKEGVKAGHLAYIGDATVGAESNIGAGTIFCNYDGKDKHHTHVEAEVFVGSNSCLVAPLRIGRGAYIGAGSTMTKDVPAGALGVGRARQANIEDWTSRKKK